MNEINLDLDPVDIQKALQEADEHAEDLIDEYITPYIEEIIDYFYPDLTWEDIIKYFRKAEQ